MTERTIFLEALDIPDPADRAAYLDRKCGPDADLRRGVESLLAAHAAAGEIFDPADRAGTPVRPPKSVVEPVDPLLTSVRTPSDPMPPGGSSHPEGTPIPQGPGSHLPTGAAIGTMIAGKYKLLERLGEGGMGEVWLAEQSQPVRRKVALKLLKPGMDSRQVVARFEAERQALAVMDHSNIAKVLDGGATTDGHPFFVMELVKGVPITEFCDARRLTPRQRLELFIPVCQAIQHAHQKGIIHRDIKPSNVLVAIYDDKPVPKVIDFGVAKATGTPLTENTIHTVFHAVVGTLRYMSPEQATFNQLDIDTRSDIYSLGVLLYELLTGTTPVEKARVERAALLEMLRVVRDEEPPRPSVRLTATETRASIAATRGTEATKLSKLLRGELDWIVMKSLEKDRSRRYETATSLARDVARYLADEVVEARPPSVGYRVRKFLRKHRGPLVAACLVLIAVIGGACGTIWQGGQKQAAQLREENERFQKEAKERESVMLRESMLHNKGLALYAWASFLGNADKTDPTGVTRKERFLKEGIDVLEEANTEYPDHLEHAYFLSMSYLSLAEININKIDRKSRLSALTFLDRSEELIRKIHDADPQSAWIRRTFLFSNTDPVLFDHIVLSEYSFTIHIARYTVYLILDRISESLVEFDLAYPAADEATPSVPPGRDVVPPRAADVAKMVQMRQQWLSRSKMNKGDAVFFRTILLRGAETEQSSAPWSRGQEADHLKAMRLAAHLANSRGVAEPAVFNAACAFALASAASNLDELERDRRAVIAVGYLDRICQAGYFRHPQKGQLRRSEIAKDHDLDSLRTRGDFCRVLAQSQVIPPQQAPPPRPVNR